MTHFLETTPTMNKLLYPLALLLFFSACELDSEGRPKFNQSPKSQQFQPITVNYPSTTKDTTVQDNYHGKVIADPYRWLEDDHSEATTSWVKDQNKVTFDYLSKLPHREAIRQRLEKLWNYERFGTPFEKGGRYFYFKNNGLQNQSVLYVQDDLNSAPSQVLDPNNFSADGTSSLGGFSFSKNGQYLAYEVSEGGSD